MSRRHASLYLSLALAGVLLGGASCAHVRETRTAQGCEVTDLGAVFRDPASYSGRKFCGEALGIPQGTGISFFPPGYDYSSSLYDVVMFLSDRRAMDRLRLSQTGPFRVRLEGRIRLAEGCFSTGAAQGESHCTPIRRPIFLQVSRVGTPVRQ